MKPTAPASRARASVRPQPAAAALAPQVQSALESPGQALEPGTRAAMEARFGHDFGQVRVHTGGSAGVAAKDLQSLAFTYGQDIVFAAGQYQPHTPHGMRLLAHELAHTVQQRGAVRPVRGFSEVSRPGEPLEREAESAASRVAEGGSVAPAGLSVGAAGARGLIARRVDPAAASASGAVTLDSTRIIETLVRIILLSLQVDPSDRSGRVRRQLEPLPQTVRDAVVAQLRERVAPARLEALLSTVEAAEEEAPAPGETEEVRARSPEEQAEAREEGMGAAAGEAAERGGAAEARPGEARVTGEEARAAQAAAERAAAANAARGAAMAARMAAEAEAAERRGVGAPATAARVAAERLAAGAPAPTPAPLPAEPVAEHEKDTSAKARAEAARRAPSPAQAVTAAVRASVGKEAAAQARTGAEPSEAAEAVAAPEAAAEEGPLAEEAQPDEARAAGTPGRGPRAVPGGATPTEGEGAGGARAAGARGRGPRAAAPGSALSEAEAADKAGAKSEGPPPDGAPPLQLGAVEATASAAAAQGTAQEGVAAPTGAVAATPAGSAAAASSTTGAPAGGAATAGGPEASTAAAPEMGAAPAGDESEAAGAEPAPAAEGATAEGASAAPAGPEGAEAEGAPAPEAAEAGATREDAAAEAGPVAAEEVAAAEEEGAVAQVLPEPEPEVLPTGSPPEVEAGPTPEQLGAGAAAPSVSAPPAESSSEPSAPATTAAPGSAADVSAEQAAASVGAAPEALASGPTPPEAAAEEGAAPAEAPASLEAPAPEPESAAPASAATAGAVSVDLGSGAMPEAGDLAGDLGGGEAMATPAVGGGGGGSAVPEPPTPSVPDVSQADPVSAMGSLGNLPAVQLQQALGGVSASATRTVQEQRQELAASPPQMERPSGAPEAGTESEGTAPATQGRQGRVERAPEGAAVPVPSPAPLPQAPVLPTASVPAPQVSGAAEITAEDARQVVSAVRELPTRDPALNVTVGAAPALTLEGNADPARMREQRERLEQGTTEALTQGRGDVAQPMGEDHVLPEVPEETLQAHPPSGGGGGAAAGGGASAAPAGGGGAAGGGADDVALSVIAEQERGDELRASVAEARSALGSRVREHGEQVTEERARSQEDIDALVAENASAQTDERSRVRRDVSARREEWSREQDAEVSRAREQAGEAGQQGARDIERERAAAEGEAAGHVRQGDEEVAEARQDAERNAARERRQAEGESGGIFGWLGSRVRAFFDRVKRAIQEGFERARRLVRAAIQRARQLAMAAIERGRRAIVGAIRWVGDRLVAIGDTLLAAFPRLRDRFRRFIQERVAQAEAAVNRLAEALKQGVQRALDLLGAALDAALGLLERGLLAAVDAVNQVVQGALNAARAVAQALGAFAQLIRDIAANPGQWLRNLGASVVDGIRNHLIGAFRQAIRQWFNETVEGLLGLGSAILNLLRNGGITFQQIARMAWEGLKSVIPMLLVQLLIERLVSMIVPAAGAVLAIIQGLQAAWGTVSRIIQAFQQFFAFLRAVKDGNAGPQFAQALASAAIVVIQFVAFFLLRRLVRPAARIGQRLRAMAQRIGRMLQRAVRTVARGARAAGRGLMRGVRAVGRAVARGARAAGRAVARGARAVARTRLGRLLRRGWRGMRSRLQRARERIRQWRQRRRQQRQTPQQRLDRAVAALRPRIQSLLRRGVSRFRLRAQLGIWRAWYRLTRLYVESPGARDTRVIAVVNPREPLSQVYHTPGGTELFRLIHRLGEETRDWMGVQETVGDINAQRLTGGGERGNPLVLQGEQLGLGAVWDLRQHPLSQGQPQHTLLETLGARVREQQSPIRPVGLGNIHIDFPTTGSSYADIHQGLVALQSSARVGERDIADVLRRLARGQSMPPWVGRTPGAAPLLASTTRLLQLESARYSSSIVHTPMLLDLLAHRGSQRMGLQEAFASIPTVTRTDRQGRQVPVAGGGGLFPASQIGAGAGYRGMMSDLAEPAPRFASGLAATRDQRRRHMEFVFRWIHSRMEAQQMDFTSRSEVERYIREMLEQQLRRSMQGAYGSHYFNPHAL